MQESQNQQSKTKLQIIEDIINKYFSALLNEKDLYTKYIQDLKKKELIFSSDIRAVLKWEKEFTTNYKLISEIKDSLWQLFADYAEDYLLTALEKTKFNGLVYTPNKEKNYDQKILSVLVEKISALKEPYELGIAFPQENSLQKFPKFIRLDELIKQWTETNPMIPSLEKTHNLCKEQVLAILQFFVYWVLDQHCEIRLSHVYVNNNNIQDFHIIFTSLINKIKLENTIFSTPDDLKNFYFSWLADNQKLKFIIKMPQSGSYYLNQELIDSFTKLSTKIELLKENSFLYSQTISDSNARSKNTINSGKFEFIYKQFSDMRNSLSHPFCELLHIAAAVKKLPVYLETFEIFVYYLEFINEISAQEVPPDIIEENVLPKLNVISTEIAKLVEEIKSSPTDLEEDEDLIQNITDEFNEINEKVTSPKIKEKESIIKTKLHQIKNLPKTHAKIIAFERFSPLDGIYLLVLLHEKKITLEKTNIFHNFFISQLSAFSMKYIQINESTKTRAIPYSILDRTKLSSDFLINTLSVQDENATSIPNLLLETVKEILSSSSYNNRSSASKLINFLLSIFPRDDLKASVPRRESFIRKFFPGKPEEQEIGRTISQKPKNSTKIKADLKRSGSASIFSENKGSDTLPTDNKPNI